MARQRLSTVNFGVSNGGLATVGYTLYNTNGTTHQARTTSDVTEFGTSTGVYGATINMPSDKAVLVMWDTGVGGGDTRYGSEDNNTALDSIQDGTDMIRLIWNSIKNQGDFFAAVLDKLGLIQKNKGLVKQDLQEAIKSIEFPKQPELKLPDLAPLERMIETMSMKTSEAGTKASENFKNMDSMLARAITSLQDAVKTGNADARSKAGLVLSEMQNAKKAFGKMDDLIASINAMKAKASEAGGKNSMDEVSRKELLAEIASLKGMLANTIAMLANAVAAAGGARSQPSIDLLTAFGGKR